MKVSAGICLFVVFALAYYVFIFPKNEVPSPAPLQITEVEKAALQPTVNKKAEYRLAVDEKTGDYYRFPTKRNSSGRLTMVGEPQKIDP